MKMFHLLKLSLVLCISGIIFPTELLSQTIVSNCDMHGWTSNSTGQSNFSFFPSGPDLPPLPSGSAEFYVHGGGNPGAKITTNQYSGSLLSLLAELKYSTYVQDFGSGSLQADNIYVMLTVDYNGDGNSDDKLYYQPLLQVNSPLTFGVWQQWNALSGGWWSSNGTASATPTAIKSLSAIIAAKPTAKILSLGLYAGYVAGTWADFKGNADALSIGFGTSAVTLYNFEDLKDSDGDGICDDVDFCPNSPGNAMEYYKDGDHDGYGNKDSSVIACHKPPGYVTNTVDCDDSNPNVHPGAVEVCNGIDDDCDGLIDEDVALVNAGPDATVYYLGPGISVNGYASCAALTASTIGGTGPFTYLWSNGAKSRSITVCPSLTTTYRVTVKDKNNCTSNDDVVVNVIDATCDSLSGNQTQVLVCKYLQQRCIKLKDLNKFLSDGYVLGPCVRGGGGSHAPISIYPNPSNGKFSVDLSNFKAQKIQLQIIQNGSVIYKRDVIVSAKGNVEPFDLSAQQDGIYFIRIISRVGVYTNKLIKAR